MTAKSTKNSRHKSRKSFKALARELLCNITHPPYSCRSCLNVSISGTTELAFHAQASTLFSTAQTSAVRFPLLKLTLTLAQHHAGFVLKITFANGKPRIITVSQTVPVWFWNYTCTRKKNGNDIDVDPPSLDCVIPSERSDEGSLKQC